MKNLLIIIVSSVVIFGFGYLLDRDSVPEFDENAKLISHSFEMEIPNFKFEDLNKKEYSISDFKGKVVMLNFWATWCGPCLEEFPELVNVLKTYKKDVVLVAISNDTNKKDIKKFLHKFKKEIESVKANIIIGYDPNKDISSSLFNILKLPETFILNRSGKIIKKAVGAGQWRDGNLLGFFTNII